MERPRKVYVISTDFFEILFSEKSIHTAQLLAQNADNLYRQAQSNIQVENNRKISVIISPDSQEFSINYTPHPYHRIVVYEAVPEYEDSFSEQNLLTTFYNELIHQVFQSVKSPLVAQISKILKSDKIQPVYLENMPFSFLEGIQFVEEKNLSEDFHINNFKDTFFLQIMSQAKLENKFPPFLQASGVMDIYPGKLIAQACGSGFCAYIQQRWGLEKFYEFCKNCGSFNLYSTEGVFYNTYQVPLNEIWNDFMDSIPLPADLNNINQLEEKSIEILPQENKGLYEHLLYSPYGIIWYDKIRHEISIYKPENNYLTQENSGLAGRKLLFLADDVNRLSLSSDGRFLVLSFYKKGFRENLAKNQTKIFDLKTQLFTGDNFNLRDSCLVKLEDGSYAIAGIYDNNSFASLQIQTADKLNKLIAKELNQETEKSNTQKIIYQKDFSSDTIPFSIVQIGEENLYSILNSKGRQFLYQWNYVTGKDYFYKIETQTENSTNANNSVIIKNLSVNENPYKNSAEASILTFEYSIPSVNNEVNFARYGFIFLNNAEPSQIWLCKNNFSGGMHFPIIRQNDLYYSSIKYDHGEIRKINLNQLEFSNEKITSVLNILNDENAEISSAKTELIKDLKAYHQFPEIFKGSVIPFMPIKQISVKNEAELWPGLGLTFRSYSDRYANNQIFASAGFGYADLTYEKYTNLSNEDEMQIQSVLNDEKINYSAAFLYDNSSTAANIYTGAIYKGTKNGDYNLKALIGSSLTIPFGMKFRKLIFNLQTDYNASTEFRNLVYSNLYPVLPPKTVFTKAYQNVCFSYEIEYTNIHQFGFSPYELRGFSAALTTNIFWDLGFNAAFTNPSQINLGFNANAKIPQLSFIKDYNNWILCFPTSIDFELFQTNGKAMGIKTELLLFGKEIQNGFSFLHLYFSRFGLKLAYDYALIYDETRVSPPDLRDFSKFYYSFVNTTIKDSISITAQSDFIPAIGFLSSALLHTDLIFEYYLRTKSAKFSMSLKFEY